MRFTQMIIVAMLACGLTMLFGGATSALGAEEEELGSISGTVLTESGAPAAGLQIRLNAQQMKGFGRGGGAKQRQRSTEEHGAIEMGMKVVAVAMTDAQGNFAFQKVKPGTYTLIAGSQSVGWLYMDVQVQKGEESKIGEIKLVKTE